MSTRALAIGLVCCTNLSGFAAATETCDPNSETCTATGVDAPSMLQLKSASSVTVESSTSHGAKSKKKATEHKPGKRIRLSMKEANDKEKGVVYIHLDVKKHKQRKLKEALKKKKAGTLSDHATAVLDEALKIAEEIEESNSEAVNPDITDEEKEEFEHSRISDAEDDDEDDAAFEHHEAVMRALEEFESSTSVEDANESGTVMTEEDLEEIFGLPATPMRASSLSDEAGSAVQGDMVGSTENDTLLLLEGVKRGVRWYGRLWDDHNAIKYCFASDIEESSRQATLDAIQHYENLIPCVGFKEVEVGSDSEKRCASGPAIYVMSRDSGCYAHVGQPYEYSDGTFSNSVCNLSPNGCDTMGIAVHELGHNLGMMHEQARTDSHNYVRIFWDHIQPSYVDQYELEDKVDKSIPYDIMSVMHYGATSFAKLNPDGSKMKTMESVDGSASVMGNNMGLTQLDAKQVASMYGCLGAIEDFKLCTNDPEKCTEDSSCVCHQIPDDPEEIIKTTDSEGCHRCQERCPDSPTGTSGICGCPGGMKKDCWTSSTSGKEFCSCEPEPHPTPAPTPAPPREAAGNDSGSGGCQEDRAWFCDDAYIEKSWCGPSMNVNGEPILEACATYCGLCDTPPPCWDVSTSMCDTYPEYCGSDSATLNDIPWDQACPKTCGKC